jgi:hypothetical protein
VLCACILSQLNYPFLYIREHGLGSSVSIVTDYGLDGPGIESRWRRDFPHPSRPALGAHPVSCKMGTGSFPGVKSGRGGTLTPHSLLVPWSWKSRAIPLPTLWATTGPVMGTLYLYISENILGSIYCVLHGRSWCSRYMGDLCKLCKVIAIFKSNWPGQALRVPGG